MLCVLRADFTEIMRALGYPRRISVRRQGKTLCAGAGWGSKRLLLHPSLTSPQTTQWPCPPDAVSPTTCFSHLSLLWSWCVMAVGGVVCVWCVQVENFRTPNFTLVAEVLYWMVQRYDISKVRHLCTTGCSALAPRARLGQCLQCKGCGLVWAGGGVRSVKEIGGWLKCVLWCLARASAPRPACSAQPWDGRR